MKHRIAMVLLMASLLLNAGLLMGILNKKNTLTVEFESRFSELKDSFQYIHGSQMMSQESAIRNSAATVEKISALRNLTSYKRNKEVSEMLHYLSRLFVFSSDAYIIAHLNEIEGVLEVLPDGLKDKNTLIKINSKLWELLKSQS